MELKLLKPIAKEMNEVMGLNPAIKVVAVKADVLKEKIIEDAAEIDPELDEFSEETIAGLKELGAWPGGDEGDEPAEEAADEAEEQEQDDQPEEDPEPEEADDNGFAELYDATETGTLKELKALVKANDVFKSLRKEAPGRFELEDLRADMLDLLDLLPEVAETEEAEKPTRKEKPVPAPKTEPKPEKEKAPKPAQKEKAPKPKKEAKEKKTSRPECVVAAIKEICKKGATIEEIMDRSDELYVEAGGASNPNATNVNRYIMFGLTSFGVVTEKNGIYKLA